MIKGRKTKDEGAKEERKTDKTAAKCSTPNCVPRKCNSTFIIFFSSIITVLPQGSIHGRL